MSNIHSSSWGFELMLKNLKAERAFSRGQRYTQKRDFENAEGQYKKTLELRPNDSGVYLHYALVLSEMGRYDEAEERINQVCAL